MNHLKCIGLSGNQRLSEVFPFKMFVALDETFYSSIIHKLCKCSYQQFCIFQIKIKSLTQLHFQKIQRLT